MLVSTLEMYPQANCFRIRRDSDDAELDIGFLGGQVDGAAIGVFCGAAVGYLVRWYSQGGGIDLVQANAAVQPIVYDGIGVIKDVNGYQGVLFDTVSIGAAMFLDSEIDVGDGSSRLAYVVGERTTPGSGTGSTGSDQWFGSANGNHWHELELRSDGDWDMEVSGSGQQEWRGGERPWVQNVPFCFGTSTPGFGNGAFPAYVNGTVLAPTNTPNGSNWGNGRNVRLGSGQFTNSGSGANAIITEFGFYDAPNPKIPQITQARGAAFGQ